MGSHADASQGFDRLMPGHMESSEAARVRSIGRTSLTMKRGVGLAVRITFPPATSHTNPSKAADLLM